jgi:predicted transcriptional regulator
MPSDAWRLSPKQLAQAKKMLETGMKRTAIAKFLGCSHPTIYRAFPVEQDSTQEIILKLRARVKKLEEDISEIYSAFNMQQKKPIVSDEEPKRDRKNTRRSKIRPIQEGHADV